MIGGAGTGSLPLDRVTVSSVVARCSRAMASAQAGVMTGPVRVMVVDDQPSFLRAAARSLAADPALDVVRAVASASAAFTALEEGIEVDIALIDLSMPEMSGVEAIAWIHRSYPDIVSVLMSTYEPDELPASAR